MRRKPEPTQERVYDCIAQNITAVSWIAQRTGFTQQQVKNAIEHLAHNGRVVKLADGRVRAWERCALQEVWR